MGILKITSIMISFLLLFIACKDVDRIGYNFEHRRIYLKNWNIKENPIEKVILDCYTNETNFKNIERTAVATAITDDYVTRKFTSLTFDSLPIIPTNRDYKLTINDTIIYNIKNIKTDYKIKAHMPLSIDTMHNMIKSIHINNKEYKFDKPRNFLIPEKSYIIEK